MCLICDEGRLREENEKYNDCRSLVVTKEATVSDIHTESKIDVD
jgi:hypothetical protein